jgi:hypothetical protein
MKRFKLTITGLLFALLGFSQNPHNGVFFELPGKNVIIDGLIEYYDKGYYFEGFHWVDPNQSYGKGSWSARKGINLEYLRHNLIIHNSGYTSTQAVVSDDEGNRYIGGILYKTGPDLPFVAKYNVCDELEWCVLLPKDGYNQGVVMDLLITENGNEIIVLLQYLAPNSSEIKDRVFLASLNKYGALLWENKYASPDTHSLLRNPIIYKICKLNDEYYLSGYCYYAFTSNPDLFILTPLFIGIDSIFTEKWILPFGMFDNIRGIAFESIHLYDTILLSIGYRRSGSDAWGLLMFYSTNGNIIDYSQLDNALVQPTITSQFRNVERINDTLFMINGFYEPEYHSIFNMEFVVNASCSLYLYQPRPNATGLSSLIKTSDHNFMVGTSYKVGNALSKGLVYKFDQNLQSVPFDTTSYVYDSLCPYPIQSGTIDLTGCMVLTSTDWIPTPQEYYARIRTIPITIYPNPAKDNITFALENTEHHRNIELRCFNLLGMQQHQTKILRGQQQASANVSAWPPGMYIAVVYSDGKPVGRGKFVVQR